MRCKTQPPQSVLAWPADCYSQRWIVVLIGLINILMDGTWFNIMSYHDNRDRFTSDQLEAMTDDSNKRRIHVATGVTRFVDDDALGLLPSGSSTSPFKKLKNAIDAANGGDIVLMRPGSYTLEVPLAKAVTLRATRGNATVRAQ